MVQTYRNVPGAIEPQGVYANIYLSVYNAALIGLIGKRSWGWLSNPNNHEELTSLAEDITEAAIVEHVIGAIGENTL